MFREILEKIKIWIKTKRQLEEQIKNLNKELNKVTQSRDKLKDKLDKDTQIKTIERLIECCENYKQQRNMLRNENTDLRFKIVELESEIRNLKAEINKHEKSSGI